MSEDTKKSDDRILSYVQSGDKKRIEALIREYKPIVEQVANKYTNSPMERDDIVQEGLIGLLAATKTYDSSRGASFKTYAKICIDNAIQSALRKYYRLKDIPVQNVVEYHEEELSPLNTSSSAEDIFIAHERISMLTKALQQNLSDFENEVLRLHIVGCSYNEIAERLCKSPKAVDNALQRVRKKLSNIKL